MPIVKNKILFSTKNDVAIEIIPKNENIGAHTQTHNPSSAIAIPAAPSDVDTPPMIDINFVFVCFMGTSIFY